MSSYDQKRRVDLARPFQIDANRINARGSQPNMTRLEKWHQDGVVHITMSEVAQVEAAHGDSARARKAFSHIFTMSRPSTPQESALFQEIERILFPGGARTQSEKNDVEIVFNAKKYGCTLITADGGSKRQPGGILGHREELARLGISVITDVEAVAWVEERIRERDELAREGAREFGLPLPDWVGKDL